MSKEQLWVRWRTRDRQSIKEIRARFNMPSYTTVNGLTPCEIDHADIPLLEETARRGFLSIFHAKWCKNGAIFSFKYRK